VSIFVPIIAAGTLLASLIVISHALFKFEQQRAEDQIAIAQAIASKAH
jgi:hypothetical protein